MKGLAAIVLACLAAGCSAMSDRPAHPGGRGVVLFVGDGMGIASITAARVHKGAREGLARPSGAVLNIDRAPRASLVRTAALDNMVTDSAASMTAMVTGAKVPNLVLSLQRRDDGSFETLTTLLELAEERGMSTGVVTTTRLTHATPAALFAHQPDRFRELDIAAALVPGKGNPALGDGVEVLMGGGRAAFLPQDGGGGRSDGRDLISELKTAGYDYAENAEAARSFAAAGSAKLLGLFHDSHLSFEVDRDPSEPSLAEMTALALDLLRRDPDGYLLVVEGGRIDHAHHRNQARRAVLETLALDEAVGVAIERVGAREMVVVTADHDHTMVIAGYPPSGSDVFSLGGVDDHGHPYTVLQYGNGPGAAGDPAPELGAAELEDNDYQYRAGVPLGSETHGGMDVPVYVFGPEEAYRHIAGSIDNTEIFGLIRDWLFQ